MYVGQSERNLEQVLEVARSLEPVVIFVDEIDQAFSNRRGMNADGGVEQRLLARLLEFMDDKHNLGKVIWIAASNRPDLIDEALLSRFKLRIPFLLPDHEACDALLREQLPRQADFVWLEEGWGSEVERLIEEHVVGKFSGRELETVVRTALWRAEDDYDAATRKADSWEQHRTEQAQRFGMVLPLVPIHTGPDGSRAVHPFYLCQAIQDARAGHNAGEYTRQALLALQGIPFDSAALRTAVKTALPPEVARQILSNDRIDEKGIARLLKQSDF